MTAPTPTYVQTCSTFFIQVIYPMLRRKEAEIHYVNGEPVMALTAKGSRQIKTRGVSGLRNN